MVFTFLGFSLGLKATRSRGQNSGSKAIFSLIGYYALFFGLVSLGKSGTIPMYVSVFLPTISLFIYALKKFETLDWQS
jgi:lipopolysaccharide export LptBFGC system permease protein LptF